MSRTLDHEARCLAHRLSGIYNLLFRNLSLQACRIYSRNRRETQSLLTSYVGIYASLLILRISSLHRGT